MAYIKTNLGNDRYIQGYPDKCPFCHKVVIPIIHYAYENELDGVVEILLSCPNIDCEKSFIGYYPFEDGGQYKYSTFGNLENKVFSDSILIISPLFVEIYNQAFFAEQHHLSEICGVGYRKSLEFLIKDYIILNNPDEIEKIQKKLLGQCIAEYIDDARIKTVAKRAAWLGNDETHYIRKWNGKNLQDLKKLIELTLHWIEMELLTKDFEEQMPE